MRVCIVRQTYYPRHRNLRRNAEAILSQGFSVDVICLRQKGEKSRETMNGVNIYRLPLEHRRGSVPRYFFEYSSFFIMTLFTLGWLGFRKRYKVVEVDTMPDFLVFATIIPKLLGAKIILFLFENMPALFSSTFQKGPNHIGTRLLRCIEQASARYAHRVIAADGPAYKRVLERNGTPGDKISVVLNVPDNLVFSGSHPTINHDSRYFRLIVLSSLLPRYGVQTVIKAIPFLRKDIPELKVDIVGIGEDLAELKELARNYGVEAYVDFTGWVPQELVPAYVNRADVAIAPMLHDVGLPNKIFDYFALGKPCVVSALPSLTEAFDGSCVLFFKPGDENDMASCILKLYREPKERSSLGAKGRAFYNRVQWSVMRNEYFKVYRECLGKLVGDRQCVA